MTVSGAEKALAYNSLQQQDRAEDWGRVMEWQIQVQSEGFIIAMPLGGVLYDPATLQQVAA